MFVALRDLRRARGRFAMIGLVVVLMTVLVTFLSGLTAGLSHQNISAVQDLPGRAFVFADNGSAASFDQSSLTPTQVDQWRDIDANAMPIGISRGAVRGGHTPNAPLPVAIFGIDDEAAPGTVTLSTAAAEDLGVATGATVDVAGTPLRVGAVAGDEWYSHSPVVYVSMDVWRTLNPQAGAATIMALNPNGHADTAAASHVDGTVVTDRAGTLAAMPSYQSENKSLTLMTVMLLVIAALVVGAFFMIWTVQRVPDIAVLKALGATTLSLLRDSLGQALLILTVAAGVGVAITAAAGSRLSGVPFVLSTSTTLIPGVAIVVLGMIGAAAALRFLITTDPLTALGGQR